MKCERRMTDFKANQDGQSPMRRRSRRTVAAVADKRCGPFRSSPPRAKRIGNAMTDLAAVISSFCAHLKVPAAADILRKV